MEGSAERCAVDPRRRAALYASSSRRPATAARSRRAEVVGAVDGDVLLRDQCVALLLRLHVLELRGQTVGLVARGVVLLVQGDDLRLQPVDLLTDRSSWESSASNADLYDQNALTTDCRSWNKDE